MNHRKKLIEVALPLDAINAASAREKSIRHGHPSTLHLWWARRGQSTSTPGGCIVESVQCPVPRVRLAISVDYAWHELWMHEEIMT